MLLSLLRTQMELESMSNQINKIVLLIVLLTSQIGIGQTIEEVFLELPDTFFLDCGLPKLDIQTRLSIIEGESIPMGEAGNIGAMEVDTINQLIGLAYSNNFDESGFMLWMTLKKQKKKDHLIYTVQEGDHCCDWTVKLSGAVKKKGHWIKQDGHWPEITWASFYNDPLSDPKYDFLKRSPDFTVYPKDYGFEIQLAYDLIALGYDFGEEFLQGIGKNSKKLLLIWDPKKGVLQLSNEESSNQFIE